MKSTAKQEVMALAGKLGETCKLIDHIYLHPSSVSYISEYPFISIYLFSFVVDMTADLTALISLKQSWMQKQNRNVSYFALPGVCILTPLIQYQMKHNRPISYDILNSFLSILSIPQMDAKREYITTLHPDIVSFRNSTCYRTRCNILIAIDTLLADLDYQSLKVFSTYLSLHLSISLFLPIRY